MDGIGATEIQFGLLAGFFAMSLARPYIAPIERNWTRILGVLVVLGLVAYLGSVRLHPSVSRVHIHHWDVYHYYVGAKYFAELGQGGLYEATVIADFEDDRDGFRSALPIRDLRDSANEVPRSQVLSRGAAIRQRFATPQRWREFKNDIAFFRAADPERWRSSVVQRDHGYNGTPLVTALLGGLANWSPGGMARFLAIAVWLDLVAVIAIGSWIAARAGPVSGLAFGLFWLLNPLNDYDFTGGAFLRQGFLIATACGVVALRTGSRMVSGVWLAVAAALRIFPIVFPMAVLAHDLIGPGRRERLHENRAFYAAFALTAAIVVGLTSAIPTPDGRNAWLEQIEQVASREALQSPNGISLRFPFLYSDEHNVAVVLEAAARGESIDWLEETNRTFETRQLGYLVALALLGVGAVVFVRRVSATEALFAGIVALYGVLIVSHYYYALLAVVPLMFREDRRVLQVLAFGFMAVAASGWFSGVREAIDLHFAVASAVVGAMLAVILALRWFGAARVNPPGTDAFA